MAATFFTRKIIYPLLILLSVSFALCTTRCGLELFFTGVQLITPGCLRVESITGSLLNGIEIVKLDYTHAEQQIQANHLVIDLNLVELLKFNLIINGLHVEGLTLLNNKMPPLYIKVADGHFKYAYPSANVSLTIDNLEGNLEEQALQGMGSVRIHNQKIYPGNIACEFLNQSFRFQTAAEGTGAWQLHYHKKGLPAVEIKLQGSFEPEGSTDYQGRLNQGLIQVSGSPDWHLTNPVPFDLSYSQPKIKDMLWALDQSTSTLFVSTDLLDETRSIKVNVVNLPFNILQAYLPQNFSLEGAMDASCDLKYSFNSPLQGTGKITVHTTKLHLNQIDKAQQTLVLTGGHLDFLADKQKLKLDFALQGLYESFAKGALELLQPIAGLSLKDSPLQGQMTARAENLTWLAGLIPEISDVHGQIRSNIKIEGSFKQPRFKMDLALEQASFALQRQGLKITGFNALITAEESGLFKLQGRGVSGKGSFSLSGEGMPFSSEALLKLSLNGENVQVINTKAFQVIANPKLVFELKQFNDLSISGQVYIPDATLDLDKERTHTVSTQDVIFSDRPKVLEADKFKIHPNVFLRFENNVKFRDQRFEAIVGGKIQVEEYNQGFLLGSGRLTLKSGVYRLNGQKFYIHHGRLIFQPLTLLTNPSLDIRLTPKPANMMSAPELHEIGLYVQGTLKAPIIQPYSNENLSDTEVLQRLGFANPLTALFANLSVGDSFIDTLQSRFGLDEVNLETEHGTEHPLKSQNMPAYSESNTMLTLGKRLTPKLLLQLQQGLSVTANEASTKVRLKYFLDSHWAVSTEVSNTGTGADIMYSNEKD